MKKIICASLIILTLFAIVSCSSFQDKNQIDSDDINFSDSYQYDDVQTIANENINDDGDDTVLDFLPPAYITDINFSSDDPSNNEIRFSYDSQGRITDCYYDIADETVYQSYTYSDNCVKILTFSDSTVIDEAYFEYDSDNEDIGFVELDGYYFKGICFEPITETDYYYEMITEEEAVALVRDMVGEGFGLLPEGLVERNGEQYYSVRVTYLVDEYHSSTLTRYLVKADGSEIVDYFE